MIEIRKVLVPVDFSECSKAALDYAIYFGKALKISTVDVLHVWKPPSFIDADTKLQTANGPVRTLIDFARSEAGKAMQDFLSYVAQEGGYEVRGRLELGEPYQKILEVAGSEQYDLIIMGTHGEEARARLGSIAEKVVRHARCPVVTIRTPGRAVPDAASDPAEPRPDAGSAD
jgi:universal stress protein A